MYLPTPYVYRETSKKIKYTKKKAVRDFKWMVEYFSKNYPLLFKLIKRESINVHHVNQNKTCKSNSITFKIIIKKKIDHKFNLCL